MDGFDDLRFLCLRVVTAPDALDGVGQRVWVDQVLVEQDRPVLEHPFQQCHALPGQNGLYDLGERPALSGVHDQVAEPVPGRYAALRNCGAQRRRVRGIEVQRAFCRCLRIR